MTNQRILVGIDSLLDTHLGTVSILNQDALVDVISNGYHHRKTNNIWELSDKLNSAVYRSKYKHRSKEVLKQSTLTDMVFFVHNLLGAMSADHLSVPMISKPEVVVNLHPYQFTEDEKDELIDVLHVYWGHGTVIKTTSISLEELSPTNCKGSYSTIILNDFNEWIKLHNEELLKNKIHSIDFYAPELWLDTETKIEDLLVDSPTDIKNILSHTSIFENVKILLGEFIDITYLPIHIYTAFTPHLSESNK